MFDSYDAERIAWSRLLLDEVLRYAERDIKWLTTKTVVSIGCGCTGELAAFPAEVKIGIDPDRFTTDENSDCYWRMSRWSYCVSIAGGGKLAAVG